MYQGKALASSYLSSHIRSPWLDIFKSQGESILFWELHISTKSCQLIPEMEFPTVSGFGPS